MPTEVDSIRNTVLECIRDFVPDDQTREIDDTTSPIRDLGLKSEDGVDYACSLSERLGFEIPYELNPFVDDKAQRPRTMGDIVSVVSALVRTGGSSDARD